MNNEQIKELLRELSQNADETGAVKSRTVRINFDPEDPPAKEREEAEEEASEEPVRRTSRSKKSLFGNLHGSRGKRKKTAAAKEIEPQMEEDDLIAADAKPQTDISEQTEIKQTETEQNADQASEDLQPETQPQEEVHEAKESQTLSWNQIQKRMRAYRRAAGLEPQDDEVLDDEELEEDAEDAEDFVEEDSEEDDAYEPDAEEDAEDATRLAQEENDAQLQVMTQISSKKRSADGGKQKKHRKTGKKVSAGSEKSSKRRKEKHSAVKAVPTRVVVDAPDFESDAQEFMDHGDAELTPSQAKAQERIGAFSEGLKERGIGKKEMIMILAGLILVIAGAAVVGSFLLNRQKSARVIADEGLSIVVEKEPSSWCTSGPVTLGIATKSPIQTISIDGRNVDFTGNNRTKITFEAESSVLDVMVVSEEEVLTAQVDLRRVDGEDPSVNIQMEEGKIIFQAEDSGSGVEDIWYGVINDFSEIPMYQLYTEPFVPESGVLYSYIAKDKAGNVTAPVITDLTPAKSLVLERSEIALFPGESGVIQVTPAPANAFANNIQMTVANDQIVSVEEGGVITALAEGETDVTVTADNINPVVCHVVVRTSASLTISCVGDVTLGDDINFSPLNNFTAIQSMNGSSYFFDNVRDIFSADDITFANLEGTLTDQGSRADKQYAFRGDPSYAQILVDGSIEVVSLANNHSSDYGEVSLTDTETNLTMAGVAYCKGEDIVYQDINGVRVALIGIYALDNGADHAAELESAVHDAQENGADLIVVAFHWGAESETKPNREQQTLAHAAVDFGADLVVGHHPHVLQGVEKYAGKYICYSLGNFCFGGNNNPLDKDSMIFQQTFEILRGGEIQGQEAVVIPCSISSTEDWNNYQPTPAEGEERERILAKINERSRNFDVQFE